MVSIRRQRSIYVISDFMMTALAWLIFNIIRYFNVVEPRVHSNNLGSFLSLPTVWLGQVLFPILMMALYYLSGYYNSVFFKSRVEEFISTFTTAVIGTVIIYFAAIFNDPIPDRISNYALLLILLGLLFAVVYSARLTITQITTNRINHGQLSFKTLLIGSSHHAVKLKDKLTQPYKGKHGFYNILGYVRIDTSHHDHWRHDLPVYSIDNIKDVCHRLRIKYLIIDSYRMDMPELVRIINRLLPLDLPVLVSPTPFHIIASRPRIENIKAEPLIDISNARMSESTRNLKRAGDVVCASVAIILLIPVIAIISLLIKLDSPGPIFYKQERIGWRKRPFNIIKFRTMRTDAEKNGPALSSENDKRITHIGHYLRKYRLDELPQFWNVIKGDMSLIGPRPEREFYIKQILQRAPYYILVHQVRPGITSLGMVKHGYAGTVDEMVERLQYDLIYLENVSLTVDLKILIHTVSTVLKGRGV